MSIRYSAAQQTIEWIVKSNTFKKIFNYIELQKIMDCLDIKAKSFYIRKRIILRLSKRYHSWCHKHCLFVFVMKLFDNHFWDHFECCTPFQQGEKLKCFTQKRSRNCNFKSLDQLMEHVSKFKCNHHRIIAKYLQCSLNF